MITQRSSISPDKVRVFYSGRSFNNTPNNRFGNLFINSSICASSQESATAPLSFVDDATILSARNCTVVDPLAMSVLFAPAATIDMALTNDDGQTSSNCWCNSSVLPQLQEVVRTVQITFRASKIQREDSPTAYYYQVLGCNVDLITGTVDVEPDISLYSGMHIEFEYKLVSGKQGEPQGQPEEEERSLLLIIAVILIVVVLVALCGCGVYGFCVKRRRRHAAQLRALGMDAGVTYAV